MARLFIGLASLSGLLAVALGAFGSHALKNKLAPELMAVYQTANQYHFYHTLALFLIGVLALQMPQTNGLQWAGFAMLGGLVLFSGSLYVLALSGIRVLGAITPLGGVSFLIAWGILTVTIIRDAWQ